MKIYAAGNITRDDWRAKLVPPYMLDRSPSITWPIQPTTIPDVLYTGPYEHICGDECTGHVAEHLKLEKTQREIAIYNADILFAWCDDISYRDFYIELGMARGMRKRHIWLATPHHGLHEWPKHLASRIQYGATNPIAALTYMINNPERRGFTWPPVSSLDQDLLGSKA